MSKFTKILFSPFVKIYDLAGKINNAIEAPTIIGEKANEAFNHVTKLTGATAGSAGFSKGVCDSAEALACKDGVCFFISVIGTCADSLQILASFVPGPNVTMVITTPISVGCKVFVWACKRSKIPWWGNC